MVSVGQKKRNAWGLYDMSGNVFEWCSDRGDKQYYKSSPASNPQGPAKGTDRVFRGGSCYCDFMRCRSMARSWLNTDYTHKSIGFRVVRDAE